MGGAGGGGGGGFQKRIRRLETAGPPDLKKESTKAAPGTAVNSDPRGGTQSPFPPAFSGCSVFCLCGTGQFGKQGGHPGERRVEEGSL